VNNATIKKVAAALPKSIRKLAKCALFELGKNAVYTVEQILETVFKAATNATSIEQMAEISGGPNADTIRYHLNEKVTIEDIETMLKEHMKRYIEILKRKFGPVVEVEIAEDWTDEMFYGDKNTPSIIGTKPKAGTCRAFEYFTVSIVMRGYRFLLFAYPMDSRENLVFYKNRALQFIRELGLKPKLETFDRGFRSVDVFAFQKDEKIPFICPAVQDEKFERWIAAAEKFPVRFNGWQMQNADRETVEVDLMATKEFYENEKGEIKERYRGFYTTLPKSAYNDDPETLAKMYGGRWGIETAHRCEDEFRIKSTSVNATVRYLYFVASVLIYNLWVYLNLLFCKDIREFRISIKKDTIRIMCSSLFTLDLSVNDEK
jgi:hypothetical protein